MSTIRTVEMLKHLYKGQPIGSVARESVEIELRAALTAFTPLDELEELMTAKKDGRCVVLDEELALAMCAGACAIEKRGRGAYVWDVLGNSKEMPYALAANALRNIAVPFLTRAAAEAAKEGQG